MLSKTRGVAHRAAELKRFLRERFPNEKVHVIAHSMGGLDARYMISRLGMEDRVLSLTTVGTPHRGSKYADWGIRRLSRSVKPFLQFWGVPTDAFDDLTTEACADSTRRPRTCRECGTTRSPGPARPSGSRGCGGRP